MITGVEMDCIEKMFTRYVVKSIRGIKIDYFRKTLRISNAEISMETVSLPSESTIIRKKLTSGSGLHKNMDCDNDSLSTALDELTDKQGFIIGTLYADKYTEKETAQMLGISQQGVYYHKEQALKKLKSVLMKTEGENLF